MQGTEITMNGTIVANDQANAILQIDIQGRGVTAYNYQGKQQFYGNRVIGDLMQVKLDATTGAIKFLKKIGTAAPPQQAPPQQQYGQPAPQQPQAPKRMALNSRDQYWEDKNEWDKENSRRISWHADANAVINIYKELLGQEFKSFEEAAEKVANGVLFLRNAREHQLGVNQEAEGQPSPQPIPEETIGGDEQQ